MVLSPPLSSRAIAFIALVLAAVGPGRLVYAADSDALRLVVQAGHSDAPSFGDLTPDGRLLATTGGDGTARVWDTETGRLRRVVDAGRGNRALGAVFLAGGRDLLTVHLDATWRVHKLADGTERRRVQTYHGALLRPVVSPDGRWLAVAAGGQRQLCFSLQSGQALKVPVVKRAQSRFSADGRWLIQSSAKRLVIVGLPDGAVALDVALKAPAEISADGGVVIYRDAAGSQLLRLPSVSPVPAGVSGHDAAVLSPGGDEAILRSEARGAALLSIETNQATAVPLPPGEVVYDIAFPLAGPRVLTRASGRLRLRDARSGVELARFEAPEAEALDRLSGRHREELSPMDTKGRPWFRRWVGAHLAYAMKDAMKNGEPLAPAPWLARFEGGLLRGLDGPMAKMWRSQARDPATGGLLAERPLRITLSQTIRRVGSAVIFQGSTGMELDLDGRSHSPDRARTP
ncbi:MAG: hypothetical protein ACI9WU_001679 [Myxococcota bacterium]